MSTQQNTTQSTWSIFLIFLRLGLTSFGGPVAHLGYFREEFVARRKWMSEQQYAELVALCQFLPGPASSQVGLAVGMSRGGYAGALAAWAGFTFPSAITLILFAIGLSWSENGIPEGAIAGLKIVAVAVVAGAVRGMAGSLCKDKTSISIMIVSCAAILLFPYALIQLLTIAAAACTGILFFRDNTETSDDSVQQTIGSRRHASVMLILFFALLAALPALQHIYPTPPLALFDIFYRTGSLVFGGGHVVLPLLQAEVVPNGLVTKDVFLSGYGAAQAVPGPLFTFAAFLGASMTSAPTGWSGGLLALIAIFIPSFLLIAGTLPFRESLQHSTFMRSALNGVNPAVVGILLAALYNPVWTSAIHQPRDFVLVLFAYAGLVVWKIRAWAVVCVAGSVGWLLP